MDRRPGPPQSALNTDRSTTEIVAPARLSWRDRQPYSVAFQDIYHAKDGPGEVNRVFIEPSRVEDKAREQPDLLIGELGFGTGLNFAVVAEVCLKLGTAMHYVSFDAAPIGGRDFQSLCSARQHEHPIYAELGELYPPLISGWHRRQLAMGQITLSLFWGDAAAGLADIGQRQTRPFDVWFLDGFAPDRNPAMWSSELLRGLGTLCRQGSTLATFTAAGRVRRALEDAGFSMRRVDQRQHKQKHESLAGVHRGTGTSPWRLPSEVHVVGAGLAGASAARHLAERGVSVKVLEAASEVAAGASSIPTTVLHPRLLGDGGREAALRCHAYLYSSAYCTRLLQTPATGALQLPGKNADQQRLHKIAERYAPSGEWLALLPAEVASARAHWQIRTPALWFPHSRIIDTPGFCKLLLDHPNITISRDTPITRPSNFPTVLACGIACSNFAEAGYLETTAVHGQVDTVRTTSSPTVPLLGNGYLVPRENGLLAGTTYEYEPWDPEAATRANLAQLEDGGRICQWLARARATRCVSSDRTPIAGRLYTADNVALPNTYVSTGHGSMGNVFSHFAAALVTSQICGDFAPTTLTLESAISSQRFRLRQARRGFRHGAHS